MHTLEYQSKVAITDRSEWATIALTVIPFVVPFVAFVSFGHWAQEPFMCFSMKEAVIFGGGAFVAVGLTLVWLTLARRCRLRWFVILPVLCWLGFNIFVTAYSFYDYFNEGWNQ